MCCASGVSAEIDAGLSSQPFHDWIIKGVHGEFFYPCKPDIFEAAYEAVEDTRRA